MEQSAKFLLSAFRFVLRIRNTNGILLILEILILTKVVAELDIQDSEVLAMLLSVIRTLVDVPEAVRVVATRTELSTTFEVSVAPEDVGKVVGSNGRTARALRVLVGANGAKQRRTLLLDVKQMS